MNKLILCLGKETNVFTEFCLYTCYLLQTKMIDVFDSLYIQLKAASPTPNNTLSAREFKDFFEKCDLYLLDTLAQLNVSLPVLKVILRMVGALSIEEQAFDRYYDHSITFANTIMSYVRKNIDNLCQFVREEEWTLFYRGLAMLVSIELLQYKGNGSKENKVAFLRQIHDQTRRQIAANKLLSRLCKLKQIIIGDMSWTDLFMIVDPTKIDTNQLGLTDSIEVLITCISKISTVVDDSSAFEQHIERDLETYVFNKSMERRL